MPRPRTFGAPAARKKRARNPWALQRAISNTSVASMKDTSLRLVGDRSPTTLLSVGQKIRKPYNMEAMRTSDDLDARRRRQIQAIKESLRALSNQLSRRVRIGSPLAASGRVATASRQGWRAGRAVSRSWTLRMVMASPVSGGFSPRAAGSTRSARVSVGKESHPHAGVRRVEDLQRHEVLG